jgi:hypothetical protein
VPARCRVTATGYDDEDYATEDYDDDWETVPTLGRLLLGPSRGLFRMPPPPPPARIARRLQELCRARGNEAMEAEWWA